jgi:uncharacterized protein YjiS (DUF1127 family)
MTRHVIDARPSFADSLVHAKQGAGVMSVHKKFESFTIADASRSVTCIDAAPVSVSVAPRRTWLGLLRTWLANARARRQLLHCQELDPRLARDIGLSKSDLARESTAPFWVPVRRR